MNLSLKKILPIAAILAILLLSPVFAQEEPITPTSGFGFDKVDNVARDAGYNPGNEPSLEQRISSIIGIFLSFLGVIFMILMLVAGYNWMTAAGDEQKIDKAKDMIRAAIIGLIIVIAAYAISIFIVSRIWGSGTTTSFLVTPVFAQITNTSQPAPVLDRLKNVGTGAGYTATTSVMDVVGAVINGFLALLGAIFILLILIAGYNWMTAAGDEEKINKAKDTIRAAIIGLIIIVGAFAIWRFVAGYLITGETGGNITGGS